jgi:hypothetical protein
MSITQPLGPNTSWPQVLLPISRLYNPHIDLTLFFSLRVFLELDTLRSGAGFFLIEPESFQCRAVAVAGRCTATGGRGSPATARYPPAQPAPWSSAAPTARFDSLASPPSPFVQEAMLRELSLTKQHASRECDPGSAMYWACRPLLDLCAELRVQVRVREGGMLPAPAWSGSTPRLPGWARPAGRRGH